MKATLLFCLTLLCFPVRAQTLADYKEFIEQWEGRSKTAYECSEGFLTIGVGHKIDRQTSIKIDALTDAQIERLLAIDTVQAIQWAKANVKTFDKQPEIVKLILVDLNINLGKAGFSKFENTIKACNSFNYQLMSEELKNSRWFFQTGRRAKHHVRTLERLVYQ